MSVLLALAGQRTDVSNFGQAKSCRVAETSPFNFYSDDGWILGVDGGASQVSGAMWNPPPLGKTAFTGLTVVGAYNTGTRPTGQTTVVNFPAPGNYSFEVDYTECCGGQLTLTMTQGQNSPTGVRPSGALTLTATTSSPQNTGQNATFTATATDASGAAVQGATVILNISGANPGQTTAITNSSGQATLSYTGTNAGTDAIQASALINGNGAYSNVVNMTWTGGTETNPDIIPQGWIGSPANGAVIQGQVPITVASTVSLSSGTLKFWPTSNPSAVTTLNANTTGSGTIGTFDTTLLPNGGYTIQLNAVANGTSAISAINVVVVGDYKPGRMIKTVTDFKVPLAGIPISITRTYDSLQRNQIEDFGNGWKLGTTVELTVDAMMNVTFNFNGERETFYFQPQPSSPFFAWIQNAQYVPQPGFHGTLTSNGCSGVWNVQGIWQCVLTTSPYQPTTYTYTDPVGRVYTISSSGQLQTIKDLNGNTITFGSNGITSSVGGALVAITRDSQNQNRITQIKDLNGNPYTYGYDSSGNLQTVTLPTSPATSEAYTYATDHSLLTDKDPNGNTTTAVYYSSAGGSCNDQGNAQLDGRLCSVTGPSVPNSSGSGPMVSYITNYSYDLGTNTTTISETDNASDNLGTVTRVEDNFGKPTSITDELGRTTTYVYYPATDPRREMLESMTDPCGQPNASCSDMTTGASHTTTYNYDSNGFPKTVTDPMGDVTTTAYNQFGGIVSLTDAANLNTTATAYDGNFNPTLVTDNQSGPGTNVATFSNYDSMGNFRSYTDAAGNVTTFDYFQSGSEVGYLQDVVRNGGNEKTSFTYDAMGKVLTVTDACGNGTCSDMTTGTNHTTTYAYDALERLSTVTDANGTVTKFVYDDNGNKKEEMKAQGITGLEEDTFYAYDGLNRLTQITYPDGTTRQFSYDFRGNKTVEVDQLGHVINYGYDPAGELTSVTYAPGTTDVGTVTYAYDLDGLVKTVTDELNNATTKTYDTAGRLTSVTDALGGVTSYTYDGDGHRKSVTEPDNQASGLSTTYTYDPRGRASVITYPATATQGTTTMQYQYDGMGRVKQITDQNRNITTKAYDAVGRQTSITDACGNGSCPDMTTGTNHTTSFVYDLNGNLTTVTDANGHATSFKYDTLNRRKQKILPAGQSETYNYDALGRLTSKQDFNGKTTTYNYDSMNRVTSRVPDSTLNQTTISFTYTATGQRASMADASGTTNYTVYDNRDRLKTKVTPEGTLSYTYDAHGNVLTIADTTSNRTNGISVTYAYDKLNRVSRVTDNQMAGTGGPSSPTTYAYDATGNLTGTTDPNGVQTADVPDTLNRLTQTCSATGASSSSQACTSGTALSSFAYSLDFVGNRTGVAELSGRTVAYNYDADYLLTSEQVLADPLGNNYDGMISYNYDVAGNRKALSSTVSALPPASATYSYDQNDRLSTDGYDANGNTTSSGSVSNVYDFENRMTTSGTTTIKYDGDGNRVSETVNGTTTQYLVDDRNPNGLPQVVEELVGGTVTKGYTYGVQRISQNLNANPWSPSFYGYDGHKNVRFLTSSAGAVTDTDTYDAFGRLISFTGSTPNNYLFSGEQYDQNTGLYNLRARYYQNATGRFWARDPSEGRTCSPLSLNPYTYAWDDPVNRADPTGRDTTEGVLTRQLPLITVRAQIGLAAEIVCALDIVATKFLANVINPQGLLYKANPCAYRSRKPDLGGYETCQLKGFFPNPTKGTTLCIYSCASGFPLNIEVPIGQQCPYDVPHGVGATSAP